MFEPERRIAAIVVTDIVGYSRHMGRSEEQTLSRLKAINDQVVAPLLSSFAGRLVKTMGDGLLIEFRSVVSAIQFSQRLQHDVVAFTEQVVEQERLALRIGVHLGDIIVDGEDLFGDGVNIAARLQEFAPASGIAISQIAYEQLDESSGDQFESAGEQTFKNIRRPVPIWTWPRSSVNRKETTERSANNSGREIENPTIAVLPFKNLSGDPDQEYFSDGLTEDLITSISYWRSFPVIARSSTFAFKNHESKPGEIARQLGARYLIEGSVRTSGARVRISASIVDAELDHELWADRFDRKLDDIFDVQDEITSRVAAIVGHEIEQAEMARLARTRPKDVSTWDLIAQGIPHFLEHSCAGNRKARQLFKQATQQKEDYSDAWAYLAWTYSHDLMIGCDVDRDETSRLALAAGRQAVALDDDSALAHLALSSVYVWTDNLGASIDEAQRALELNPNDVRAGFAVGNRLTLVGRIEEGIETILSALKLNSRDPYRWHYFGYLARAYLTKGSPREALDWATQAARLRPDRADIHFRLALCHAHNGDLDNARAELDKCDAIEPGFSKDRTDWKPYAEPELNDQLLRPLRDANLI